MNRILFALLVVAPAWAGFQVAPFSAEVTVPMGHALMGGGIMAAHHVVDPLYARGVVLIGGEKPLVFLSVDWCEVRNDAYDRFRDVVAEAAGTTRDHVMISSVHVHDAPVLDFTAQQLLDAQELPKALCDTTWAEKQFQNVALAVRDAVKTPRNATHYGVGQAEVKELASNRRCVMPDGSVNYSRTSATGDEKLRACDVGEHDPILRTLSFWDGDTPIAALHAYAIHPMSYYGKGGVSADFVGMARRTRESDMPGVLQVYFSGCSGDVVAGKWNDGNFNNKPILAEKLHVAMIEAWDKTEKFPLESATLRIALMNLAPKDFGGYAVADSEKEIANKDEKTFKRILAAMNLSWRKRVAAGQPIAVPAVDFGKAKFLLMPAESFVGYQLMAQKLDTEHFIFTAGYGECAPGYIPTAFAASEHFNEQQDWCWVDQTSEATMKQAMSEALGCDEVMPGAQLLIALIACAAHLPVLPANSGAVSLPAQESATVPGPRTITAYIRYPGGSQKNVNADTGLMLCLHNWGGTDAVGAPDPVQVAERYNVVAISVDYFQSGNWDTKLAPYDFGYLQALDALRALYFVFHGLDKARVPFARDRIYACGGSGGGNVSLMVNKLAPRTFACIVDISGMAKLPDEIAYGDPTKTTLNAGYSRDTASPAYLSPDAQPLRFIGNPDHLGIMKSLGNSAKVLVIHGVDDPTCPVADARELAANFQSAGLDVEPHFISKADVDGKIITGTVHSLGDRTQILFRFADAYLMPGSPQLCKRRGETDFERGDTVNYATATGTYEIMYRRGYPVVSFKRGK